MPGYNRIDLAAFVESVVPPAIIADNPELVEFIKVYALYLGQESFYINQLELQRDIDLIEESLLTELQNEIGTPIPRTFAADPRTFYKHLVDFYKSRGTPESIKAFFRLIYDAFNHTLTDKRSRIGLIAILGGNTQGISSRGISQRFQF